MRKPFEALPDCVTVEGRDYEINTDFRVWIEISMIMESETEYEEKILKLLCLAYKKELPPHLDTAVFALLQFFFCGEKNENKSGAVSEKIMDFARDEGLIYSGFVQQYGIDLFDARLHWHKFLYLLNGLGEDTAFMKIVGYRSVDCDKIKNKDTRKILRRMKKKYSLSRSVGEEEIASALESIMR